MDRRLVIVSTPRSGHHAVANWILRQHTGLRCMFTAATVRDVPIGPTELADSTEHWWYESDRRGYRDEARLVNFVRAPAGEGRQNLSVVMDCYERETLDEVCEYYRNCPTTMIIVLRNVLNTIASMIRRRPQAPFFNMTVWKSLAREAIRGDESEYVVVLFDKWHADREYRRSIAGRLGMEFTDAGRDEILNIGRGSSFSGVEEFDNKAGQMDVLNRYQDILNHPTVASKVLSDNEALKLNRILFGEYMPRPESTAGS